MMAGLRKDVDLLIKQLQAPECGCTVSLGRGGHYWVSRPGHRSITVSRSPSDQRAIQNIRRDIRKHLGIEL